MEHDPKELRDALREHVRANTEQISNARFDALYDFTADLIERHAKLREHAEAMAQTLDDWARIDACKCAAVDAFRADFPKE